MTIDIVLTGIGELQMCFKDVVFLPSGDSFYTTFVKKCGTG